MKLSRGQSLSLAKWVRQHHPRSVARVEVAEGEALEAPRFGAALDECVEWGAGKSGAYPVVNMKTADKGWWPFSAHRSLMVIVRGDSPLEVLHRCGNKMCVNVRHLRYGTHQENMDDAVRMREVRFGESNPAAKLTQAQVDEIRRRYVRGTDRTNRGNGAQLREEFGISVGHLSMVVNHKLWRI